LKAALHALNAIPNTTVNAPGYKKSYDIAAAIGEYLRHPQQVAAAMLGNPQERISLPEIDLTPEAVPDKWDAIEIEAVNEENNSCEVVQDDETEIHFYSVYLHNIDGGVSCIADCTSKTQAQVLATLLEKAVKNYTDNGYLNNLNTPQP